MFTACDSSTLQKLETLLGTRNQIDMSFFNISLECLNNLKKRNLKSEIFIACTHYYIFYNNDQGHISEHM